MFLSALQVTYRVVQVTDQSLEGRDDGGGAVSVVSTAAFSSAPQAVAQVTECHLFLLAVTNTLLLRTVKMNSML